MHCLWQNSKLHNERSMTNSLKIASEVNEVVTEFY